METYSFGSDKLDRRGFIDKSAILSCVTQERIFEMVFGFQPQEFQYVKSPFRIDHTPGCWFEYSLDGKLLFKDFGNPRKTHYDCFDAVQCFFRIPNFYLVLEFIHKNLIYGKKDLFIGEVEVIQRERKEVKLMVETRDYTKQDMAYWNSYNISKSNLIEDKVFSVQRFYALNTKKGNITQDCRELVFAFNDFPDKRKKLYFPNREGAHRFFSTCNRNDIGGVNSLLCSGRQLIITKSYKDYRVLLNYGKNVVWLQNEGMVPDVDILLHLARRFKQVLVWFDNDEQGKYSSVKIANLINSHLPGKCQSLWLPEKLLEEDITDPSDLLKQKGHESLSSFLKTYT